MCHLCGTELFGKKGLEKHISMFHDPNKMKFKCDYCTEGFRRQKDLEKHLHEQHGKVFYRKCKECDYVCKTRWRHELMHHRNVVHKGLKVYCEICDRTFVNHEVWKKHMAYIHEETTGYTCEHC